MNTQPLPPPLNGCEGPKPVSRARPANRYQPTTSTHTIDLRLDANEGTPPPIDAAAVLARAGTEALRRYPSTAGLEGAIAARMGVEPGRVIVTAGGDEAIDRACRAYLEPGRELILPTPTFEMIPRYAALAGGTVRTTPWPSGPYPTGAVCALVSPATAMIAVVSPNNPTGAVASREDLRRIAAAAPSALVLLDAAYAEFADDDLTTEALSMPSVLVVRTFSKALGLAGLRVAYAIGSEAVVSTLRAAAGPYSVSWLSAAIAMEALESSPRWVPAVVDRVRAERRDLAGLLREIGCECPDSQGNFVLAQHAQATAIRDALASRGISIRLLGAASGIPGALRISCPADQVHFDRLCAALREVAREIGPRT